MARKVFVVLPAYNEQENLGPLLDGIAEAMAEEGFSYEVIVVDDGSRDGTLSVAESRAKTMPLRIERHEVNQGLGPTIRDGLAAAAQSCEDHDIVVALDADNTHPPGLIGAMVRRVREGNEVVIASRYQPGARVLGVPPLRRLLSWGAGMLFRLVFPIAGVKDYTCGYRAYQGRLLKAAFERYGDQFVSEAGFQCMVDILLKLHRMGAICNEVPLVLRYDLKGGVSKMKVGRTVLRTLGLMARRRLGG
jgi:dolichol-phosphate mannosyltransferase